MIGKFSAVWKGSVSTATKREGGSKEVTNNGEDLVDFIPRLVLPRYVLVKD